MKIILFLLIPFILLGQTYLDNLPLTNNAATTVVTNNGTSGAWVASGNTNTLYSTDYGLNCFKMQTNGMYVKSSYNLNISEFYIQWQMRIFNVNAADYEVHFDLNGDGGGATQGNNEIQLWRFTGVDEFSFRYRSNEGTQYTITTTNVTGDNTTMHKYLLYFNTTTFAIKFWIDGVEKTFGSWSPSAAGTITLNQGLIYMGETGTYEPDAYYKNVKFWQPTSNYYVDQVQGLDAYDGRSIYAPWKTIAKVNGATFAANDSIYLRTGCEWNEGWIIPHDSLYFGEYDSTGQTLTKPIFRKSLDITSWSGSSPIYHSHVLYVDPQSVSVDDTLVCKALNLLTSSRYFNVASGGWILNYTTSAKNDTGYNGVLNSAWTVTGTSASQEDNFLRNITIPNDNTSYTTSIYVKKTVGATIYPALCQYIINGTPVYAAVVINTNNGTTATRDGDGAFAPTTVKVDTIGNWYRVAISKANNTSGNTLLQIRVCPSISDNGWLWDGAITGSNIFDAAQVEIATARTKFVESDTISYLKNRSWLWSKIDSVFYYRSSVNPSTQVVRAGTQGFNYIVDLNDKKHLTFDNLDFRGPTLNSGIAQYYDGIDSLKITNCNFRNFWVSSLYLYSTDNSAITANINNCTFFDPGGQDAIKISGDGDAINEINISDNTFSTYFYNGTNERSSVSLDALEIVGASTLDILRNTITYPTSSDFEEQPTTLTISYCDNVIIGNNIITGGAHGIYLSNSMAKAIIRYNKIMNTGDDCFWGDGIGDSSQIYYNIFYGSLDDCMQLSTVTHTFIYNNIFGHAADVGVLNGTDATGTAFKNNIFYDNGQIGTPVTGDEGGYEILCSQTSGVTLDNNLYYHTTAKVSTGYFKWGSTAYNFANWKTNSSQDANSIDSSNPLFVSPTNFNLQLKSPCIDAGTNVGLTTDYMGLPVPKNKGVDMGAYEYQASLGKQLGFPHHKIYKNFLEK